MVTEFVEIVIQLIYSLLLRSLLGRANASEADAKASGYSCSNDFGSHWWVGYTDRFSVGLVYRLTLNLLSPRVLIVRPEICACHWTLL